MPYKLITQLSQFKSNASHYAYIKLNFVCVKVELISI
jgi:hypothetical protein